MYHIHDSYMKNIISLASVTELYQAEHPWIPHNVYKRKGSIETVDNDKCRCSDTILDMYGEEMVGISTKMSERKAN